MSWVPTNWQRQQQNTVWRDFFWSLQTKLSIRHLSWARLSECARWLFRWWTANIPGPPSWLCDSEMSSGLTDRWFRSSRNRSQKEARSLSRTKTSSDTSWRFPKRYPLCLRLPFMQRAGKSSYSIWENRYELTIWPENSSDCPDSSRM